MLELMVAFLISTGAVSEKEAVSMDATSAEKAIETSDLEKEYIIWEREQGE